MAKHYDELGETQTTTRDAEAEGVSGDDRRNLPVTPGASPQRRSRRLWSWLAVLAALVALGYFLLPRVIHGLISPGAPQDQTEASTSGPRATGTSGRAAQGGRAGAAGAGGSRAVPVVAARARLSDMPVYLTGLGSVTALETVTVRTRVDGQLLRVSFREGQFVQKGELLAEIDPRPYLVQLEQAQGQLAKDEAALKNAQLDLQRYSALLAKDAISKQQVDTQAATVTQFEGSIKTDQGQIDSAKLNLTYTRITAPVAGRVGLRLVDPGNMVHAADQNGIIVLTEVRPIAVLFTLPEDALPRVLEKMRGARRLTVEAWDRDLKNRLATGALLSTDNQIDPATGTVRLKATFANESDELFPNQFVNARLLLDTLRGVVVVPTAAIQRSPESTFVWVVAPDGTAQMRPCDVQATEGDQASIARGLSAGDLVVVDGVDRLQQGTKVRAQLAEGRGGPPGTADAGGQDRRTGAPSGARPQSPGPRSDQAAGGRRR